MTTPPESNTLQRVIDANRLAKEGLPAEALELLLQCVDQMVNVGPRAAGIQPYMVFVPLADLARSYPPAQQALLERKKQFHLLSEHPEADSFQCFPETSPEAKEAYRRFQVADRMARRNESPSDALRELLWCFDIGMRSIPELRGARRSFLLGAIAKLGAAYPPALVALTERRDRIRGQWRNDADEWQDFVSINRVLKDSSSVLAFYDDLQQSGAPLPEPRWIFDQLIEAQRYADATAAYPVALHHKKFDEYLAGMSERPEEPHAMHVRFLAALSGKQLEALAGSGDVTTAASVMERILAVDRSEETLKVLRKHADRCGRPEIIPAA